MSLCRCVTAFAAALMLSASVPARADAAAFLGTKWGDLAFGTPGGVVTYSFAPGGTNCLAYAAFGCGVTQDLAAEIGAGFEDVVLDMFSTWSASADISFMQLPDSGVRYSPLFAGRDDIRFGTFDMGPGLAGITLGSPGNAVDVFFNARLDWEFAIDPPGAGDTRVDFGTIALHEIGHAIGLAHTTGFAIMAIGPPESFNRALQPDDIAGAQFLYGPAAAPVPEPATLTLLGGALAAFGGYRRRAARRVPRTRDVRD